jgi:hypothetical protein
MLRRSSYVNRFSIMVEIVAYSGLAGLREVVERSHRRRVQAVWLQPISGAGIQSSTNLDQ